MLISVIVSMGENQEIGSKNGLLWHIPEDLKHFRKITLGHPIIMGRKTHESIGRLLPGRHNIIITRQANYQPKIEHETKTPNNRLIDYSVVKSLEEAISQAKNSDQKEVFVIGGGEIYQQAIKYANKLYITLVKGKYQADTYFPDYSTFKLLKKSALQQSGKYKYEFLEYTR